MTEFTTTETSAGPLPVAMAEGDLPLLIPLEVILPNPWQPPDREIPSRSQPWPIRSCATACSSSR